MAGFSIGSLSFQWGPKHVSRTISLNQFVRIKHDAETWRDAIREMEDSYYPHRVKAQRIYMDTVINGHVHACMKRRNDLILLKDFGFFSGETEDANTTKLFRKKWFNEFVKHSLEAKFYGYSLIELGNLVNNEFPEIKVTQRENVNPDRQIVSSIVYGVNGEKFLDAGNEYYPWTVWVDTPSDKGTSRCGYGLLYKVALYEIYLRALIGANATYNDKYGMPMRKGKTTKKEGKEYEEFCRALDKMGEQAWIALDTSDDVELIAAQTGNGAGYKTYGDFEKRLEAKISKVILGHADALDSTPGKLGGGQNGEESPTGQALEDLETSDARDIEYIVNSDLIPKLLTLGFPIAPGLEFKFKNDKEKEEIKQARDASYLDTATMVKTYSDAGLKVKKDWLEKYVDIEFEEREEPPTPVVGLAPGTQKKIQAIYGG